MKKLAIIPARGGSKRIPRKNIKSFLGKPIIAYSIETALASNLFEEVMVSTDDDEIAAIAEKYGATVPFRRSDKNSGDFATTVDVINEVLATYKSKGITFEYACCLYPTAPFVTATLLKNTFQELEEKKLDSIFPILRFSYPIQRAIKINQQGRLEFFHPEYLSTRSQDLEPAYHDSGQFYWFKVSTLLENQKILTDNTGAYIISEMEAQDIDRLEDWKLAEFKYKFTQELRLVSK